MKRRIITFGGYFEDFIEKLTDKEREKVDYGLVLLKNQDRIPTKFVKYIRDGLFELRTEYNGNIYRVFFIFDKVKIATPQGDIEIKCERPTPDSHYIENISLNGKANGYRITHKQLLDNAKIEYKLKKEPK